MRPKTWQKEATPVFVNHNSIEPSSSEANPTQRKMGPRMGQFLVVLASVFASLGSFLCGYDIG